MNTDEAYELLKNAGVEDETSIQTVRRWLLERKIRYEGTYRKNSRYVLDDTDQAFNLLKDAGVAPDVAMQIVKRWLREGKIEHVGEGNHKHHYPSNEPHSRVPVQVSSQEKTIRQLKSKINGLEDHITGVEALHNSSINRMNQKIDQLKNKIVELEKEKQELQSEANSLLKENLNLRKELFKLKEDQLGGRKREPNKTEKIHTPPPRVNDYREKLGLSRSANAKEILAGYKKLLKLTHPDQGGNATAFHYIKRDYDQFRNSLK
ncbi:hypothetical protein M3182_16740 [Mesobacillus maritimus]|uniref:hypothetical protein n=1 Tax=Mesobacillus maritimus TaxID=1643336 RepID=UPI00203B1BC2|nr:hypothetical protein [Mesobacillus maritimus]MCM3587386.1 hypothetical protein [Mesobacillus maritimus]